MWKASILTAILSYITEGLSLPLRALSKNTSGINAGFFVYFDNNFFHHKKEYFVHSFSKAYNNVELGLSYDTLQFHKPG